VLTLFTCPKSFDDIHTSTIQCNALRSWTYLRPRPQIVLLGNDPGVAEIAETLGLQHINTVSRSANGIPIVSDLFSKARLASTRPLMCYINADIVLMQDFMTAVQAVRSWRRNSVMVGARVDLDVRQGLDFDNEEWHKGLRKIAIERGTIMPLSTDYFVFPYDFYTKVPDFILGRSAYDNWLLWSALRHGASLVDATSDVLVVHQQHVSQTCVRSTESDRNRQLAGWWARTYSLADATHRLKNGRAINIRGRHVMNRLTVLRQLGRMALARNNWLRRAIGKTPLSEVR